MVGVCGSFCPVPVVDTDVISCIELHSPNPSCRWDQSADRPVALQVWLPFVSAYECRKENDLELSRRVLCVCVHVCVKPKARLECSCLSAVVQFLFRARAIVLSMEPLASPFLLWTSEIGLRPQQLSDMSLGHLPQATRYCCHYPVYVERHKKRRLRWVKTAERDCVRSSRSTRSLPPDHQFFSWTFYVQVRLLSLALWLGKKRKVDQSSI